MTERDDLLQALDASLAALERGESLESVLAGYPALAADLRPLLLVAQSAGASGQLARVPVGAQVSSRSQFLARAAALQPATVTVGRRGRWWRLKARLTSPALAGRGLLARSFATLLVVAAGLGTGAYGAVAASAQSLPGDALYGVKRTVENTELILAPDAQTRARLQAEFDGRRVLEVQAVANQGRQVPVDFTGVLISMDGAQPQHWMVSGIAVLVGPQVPVEGEPVTGSQVRIQGIVAAAGTVQALRVTVLPHQAGGPDATPTATASAKATTQATPAATASGEPAQFTTTPEPTSEAEATATPAPSRAPQPTDTQAASPTDDHGGPSASRTPEATEGGGDNGGNQTRTPQATRGGGGSATGTPEATEGGGGGSPPPSTTPKPTSSGGGGPSPSTTPKPDG